MVPPSNEPFVWPRPASPLPNEKEFDPYNGNLDCQHALQVFGGMTLDQAYSEFCDRPEIYQEDFVFMGPKAFVYYFPIVDRYLREVKSNDPHDDCAADILAYAINGQLDNDDVSGSATIVSELCNLIDFVLLEVARYSGSKKIRKQIHATWNQLADKLVECEQDAACVPKGGK